MGRLIFVYDDGTSNTLAVIPDDYLPFVEKNIEQTVKGLRLLQSVEGKFWEKMGGK